MSWIENAIKMGEAAKAAKKSAEDHVIAEKTRQELKRKEWEDKIRCYLDQEGEAIDRIAEELSQKGYQVENMGVGFHNYYGAHKEDLASVVKYGTNGDTGWWEVLSKEWFIDRLGRFLLISVGKENERLHCRGVFEGVDRTKTKVEYNKNFRVIGTREVRDTSIDELYDENLRKVLKVEIVEQIKHSK